MINIIFELDFGVGQPSVQRTMLWDLPVPVVGSCLEFGPNGHEPTGAFEAVVMFVMMNGYEGTVYVKLQELGAEEAEVCTLNRELVEQCLDLTAEAILRRQRG